MNNEYLTIKEVANLIGCSVQAVYNRLEKDFKPYLKIENNKKVLSKSVLELLEKPRISSDLNESFKDILKLLERQLEEKDRQIEQLNERLKEAHQQTNASQQLQGAEKVLQIENKSHWWNKKR